MSAFKDYVTSTAFALTISRRQIEALSMLHRYGKTWLLLTTVNALIHKGLVERVAEKTPVFDIGSCVRLTEAGKAVIPLLKLSGLLVEYPEIPEPEPLPEINVVVRRKD